MSNRDKQGSKRFWSKVRDFLAGRGDYKDKTFTRGCVCECLDKARKENIKAIEDTYKEYHKKRTE